MSSGLSPTHPANVARSSAPFALLGSRHRRHGSKGGGSLHSPESTLSAWQFANGIWSAWRVTRARLALRMAPSVYVAQARTRLGSMRDLVGPLTSRRFAALV